MREIWGIFVDENLLPVGRALDEVGAALYPGHPKIPELPRGAADTTIFDAIGAKGRNLILVTRDNQIRRRPDELSRFQQAEVRAVILTGKEDLSPRENLLLILSNWDKLSRLSSSLGRGPWAIALTRGRGPTKIRLPDAA